MSQECLIKLKQAYITGTVTKGIKETLKAIESKSAKLVFLAIDCELEDYRKLIIDSCRVYNISFIEVTTWIDLRDILMDGKPSNIIIENSKMKGKTAKIGPACFCASIIEY